MPYLVVYFEKLRIIVSVWILLLDLNTTVVEGLNYTLSDAELFGDDFW